VSARVLAVSLGCPSGIGPEVAIRGAGAARDVVLVGSEAIARRAATIVGASRPIAVVASPAEAAGRRELCVLPAGPPLALGDAPFGRPSKRAGAAELAWVDAACDLVARGEASALVTGPVSKEAIARSGAPGSRGFLGHTEHLEARLGASESVMCFWHPKLTTALVTTHLALADVPAAVTPARVGRALFWLAKFMHDAGTSRPRIAVTGLNPHAGEGGLLGREDARQIAPGIRRGMARLSRAGLRAEVVGPLPAEHALRLGAAGGVDAVLCAYHDQATIAMKLLGFGEAVNVTLGLPIVRTSVDHGTGYDRAGKGTASPSGMRAALALARRLVG